jgi:hypothetical protein
MLVGRGKRVYLIAAAIRIGGVRAERLLARYIEQIGWAVSIALLLLVAYGLWRLFAG